MYLYICNYVSFSSLPNNAKGADIGKTNHFCIQ